MRATCHGLCDLNPKVGFRINARSKQVDIDMGWIHDLPNSQTLILIILTELNSRTREHHLTFWYTTDLI